MVRRKGERLSLEMILRKSFRDSCADYRDNCSLAGTQYICASSGYSLLQRMIWAVVLMAAIGTIFYYLYYMWTDTLSKPLIVSLESTEYPIEHIDFPAVAICNVNRISKKALAKFAAEEFKHLAEKRDSQEQIEKALLNFGRLIDYSYNDSLQHDRFFQRMLEKYRLESDRIVPIMKKLAPSCDDMLIRCAWAGDIVDCSSLFSVRRTANRGFCCTFNYLLNYNSENNPLVMDPRSPHRQTTPGHLHGLLVVFDPLLYDYAYPLKDIHGFDVLLFDPMHFADPHAGRVLHRMAEPNKAIFMEIKSTKQEAAKEIRKYNINTRKCRFRDELKDIFGGLYSYSACLVACKIQTIASLCKCVPFFYATNKNFQADPVCTFEDLKCLKKYKEKLLYLYPFGAQDIRGLEMELEDSLNCQECWPDCELTQHTAKTFSAPLKNNQPSSSQSTILMGINVSTVGMLAIYNPTHDARLIRLDVVFYWYEILSNFGGFCGIMIGFSIISIGELLYFFTIRYVQHFIKNYKKYH